VLLDEAGDIDETQRAHGDNLTEGAQRGEEARYPPAAPRKP